MKNYHQTFGAGLFIILAVFIYSGSPSGAQNNDANGNNSGTATGTTTEPEPVRTGNDPEGNLMIGGPGVGLNYRNIDSFPYSESAELGRYYRFVFTGIEVQADADGVPGTYPYDGFMWNRKKKNNNGHGNNCDGVDSSNPGISKQGLDSDPTVDDECIHQNGAGGDSGSNGNEGTAHVPGWWEMWAQVNSVQLRSVSFSSAELNRLSPIYRLFLTTPEVFREQNITLQWNGDGNSKDPDGHFVILGSAIKEPPVPIGKLNFAQTVYQTGTRPTFRWSVVRE